MNRLNRYIILTALLLPAYITAQDSAPAIKAGILAQVQAQFTEDQSSAKQDADISYKAGWQRQFLIQRLRFLVSGDISGGTTFFLQTGVSGFGKVDVEGKKDTRLPISIQDAQIQHNFCNEFSVIAGLQLAGITRHSLLSGFSLMGLEYGTFQFISAAGLDNPSGRDFGISGRGFLLDERLEYRAGIFSGKTFNYYSPLRFTAKVNYSFLDREKGFFYTGTTLGKQDILSAGGGFDMQGSYKAAAADFFGDFKTAGGAVTITGSAAYIDGGGSDTDSTYFTGRLPRQWVLFFEGGYFIKAFNLQPYVKFESQIVDASAAKQFVPGGGSAALQNSLRSGSRFGAGINFYLNDYNFNVKILYELVSRNRLNVSGTGAEAAYNSAVTMQVQFFQF